MVKRKEFIDIFSKKGYTKKDSAIIIDDFIGTITEILINGDSVNFHGFGTFETIERSSKEITDYQSKEKITVPSYKAPKFTAGKLLKRAIKEGYIRK